MQEAIFDPVHIQQRPAEVLASSKPAAPTVEALSVRRTARVCRQLTPAKIGVAWDKVRRVVRDLCRQRGPDCPICRLYGGQIEFQLTADHRLITLDLDAHRILAQIGRRRWAIRIVRIKTGGSGYELRKKIHTATSMLIELLLEARQ
jgi:hypothetical protein